jgi:TonB family protein
MEDKTIYKIQIKENDFLKRYFPSDKNKSVYFFGNLPKGIYRVLSLTFGGWTASFQPTYIVIPNNNCIYYGGTIVIQKAGKKDFWTSSTPIKTAIINEREEGTIAFKDKFPQINANNTITALFHDKLTNDEINASVDGVTIGKTEYAKYYNKIRRKIFLYAERNYTGSEPGNVYISFSISRNGGVRDISIDKKKSAASMTLQDIVLSSVKSASPFPPFPSELEEKNEIQFRAIIDFSNK